MYYMLQVHHERGIWNITPSPQSVSDTILGLGGVGVYLNSFALYYFVSLNTERILQSCRIQFFYVRIRRYRL